MTEVMTLVSRRLSELDRSRNSPKFRDQIKSFILSNADAWYAVDPRLAGRLVSLLSNNADSHGLAEYRKATDEEILALPGFGKRTIFLLRAALERPSDSPATP